MNEWKKRWMKLRGLVNQIVSVLTLRYTRFNTHFLRGKIKSSGVNKLHVGCGDVLIKNWLNIKLDKLEVYGQLKNANGAWVINYNLLKPWPLEEGSVQNIAGSHFIEHLDLNHGIRFLQESFRVMKKGGVIRLSCPDMELYARSYVNGKKDFFNNPKIQEWCAFKNAKTTGEIFIAKAYDSGGSHKWFYDFESLKHILEMAGFSHVKRCGRLEGRVPHLDIIEPAGRELETLYVEAVKT